MSKERQSRLVGPVIVLRTFRTDDGKLDLKKQRTHLKWLLDQGINEGNGIIMGAGGGSEGYFMSDDEWKAKVTLVAEECKGRVPCMGGIFELSATEAAKKAKFCEEVGIDFVQVSPPHYMVPIDDEVFYHFKAINDAADVGIMLYNTPWAMPAPGYEFTPAILERLIRLENIEGLKWSSYDMSLFMTVMRLFSEELSIVNNQGNVLSLPIKLGMKGFINSDGNIAPRLVLHIWDLWKNKKYEEYDDLNLKLYVDPYLNLSHPEDIKWAGMGEGPHARAVLEAMGLKLGPSFPAQQDLSDAYRKAYREGYDKSGMAEWVDWKDEYAED